MRVPYYSDESFENYKRYFETQNGGYAVYRGSTVQDGHGFGAVFSKIGKTAFPMLKQIGKRVLDTAVKVVSDISDGKSFKASASSRFKRAGLDALHDIQSGLKRGSNGSTSSSPAKRRKTNKKGRMSNKSLSILRNVARV